MTGLAAGPRIVEQAKVTEYLLSRTHPIGRYKAEFFAAFGFDVITPVVLMNALDLHARSRPVARTISSPHGVKREVRCSIETPDGRDPCIVTVWLQPAGAMLHRFITAYPA